MEYFELVKEKLNAFIRKYYISQIIKGSLIFFSIGLLYFLLSASLEYFLWLSTTGRTILFILFIIVEVFLLIRFIGIPFFRLTKLTRRINDYEAAEIIGKHFPEVNDRLVNLLQLKNSSKNSELLMASIEQKSKQLDSVPFTKAVNLKTNYKWARLLFLPGLIILLLFLAGKTEIISQGFGRMSDYRTVYLKPAPFNFILERDELSVREGEDYILKLNVEGEYFPESVQLKLKDELVFMRQISPGEFEYKFQNVTENVQFIIQANDVRSNIKTLKVIDVPRIQNYEIFLDYPAYTGQVDDSIMGTGNITVPEGTLVNWEFITRNLQYINFKIPDSTIQLPSRKNKISYSKKVFSGFPYSVSSSNEFIQNYETLEYFVKVIKDQYPQIEVIGKVDTLNTDIQHFRGELSDDYGLRRLELVYFQNEDKETIKSLNIPVSKETYDVFFYSFPGDLDLEPGESYSYYFRVFDNDAVNGSKASKTQTFSYRKKTSEEIDERKMEDQKESIDNLEERLKDFEKEDMELDDIWQLEKEKGELNYNEKKKLENFIKRQKKQNALMKNYSRKLEKSLPSDSKEKDIMEKELEKRLQNNGERLEQNEALLKELEEFADKIQKEDLGKKLDRLSKQNKSNQRNLEQLLELTKRYYIEEKKQKLANELEKLADKQDEISEDPINNSKDKQEEINKEFDEFQKEMDQLEQDNESLKKPQDIGREEIQEETIDKLQKEAVDKLQKQDKGAAQKKQKEAAKEMREMSDKMKKSSRQQEMEQLEADAETLRQILDNLIIFSFEQEALLEDFKKLRQENPAFAKKLKQQSNLRENFTHIDDSLFSLALRNPMINEEITGNLIDIDFDLEKSLERLSQNEIPQGTASQQYVITNTNDLANLLSKVLSSMQNMMAMPSAGEGEGEEFQLGDIIKKQKELMEKMQEGQEGKEGKPKEGGEGKTGEEMNGDLYEIYKEQQMLRMQMEELLKENGLKDPGNSTRDMEKIEEELLDKGMDPQTIERMQQLQYKLLQFQKANELQGMDDKRKSDANLLDYQNHINNQINSSKEYFNSTEILNRQILPLRQIYKEKVKEYFGKGND
ncbi:hypothetical protein [Christiangramia salexigens]|uniref:DUF4175 domain-containing protein n=1 Tax=Christiangramia salexigens TaxID=1913577 RepID=A0A1L3J6N6_9FLAO|nr:hypothetical protein [Christiangramia salexigens]APG60797.1 hypothetical protein LPB144_10450 [Christiangramia salexigens]